MRPVLEEEGWPLVGENELISGKIKPDVLFLGQSARVGQLAQDSTLTVLLFHGIGVKRVYYTDTHPRIDIRFVESDYRREQCLVHSPDVATHAVGFAKLDPLLSGDLAPDPFLPVNPGPKILYAPTFYPGSIEVLANHIRQWPDQWQIVIKPHQFTYTNPYYRYQVKLLTAVARSCPNVTLLPLSDYNILGAYDWADLLVSEASSTAIEFAALDRPIVVCDQIHLRPHHRLFKDRFLARRIDGDLLAQLDFVHHASRAVEVAGVIEHGLNHPNELAGARAASRKKLLGPIDGGAAERIVELVEQRFQA